MNSYIILFPDVKLNNSDQKKEFYNRNGLTYLWGLLQLYHFFFFSLGIEEIRRGEKVPEIYSRKENYQLVRFQKVLMDLIPLGYPSFVNNINLCRYNRILRKYFRINFKVAL